MVSSGVCCIADWGGLPRSTSALDSVAKVGWGLSSAETQAPSRLLSGSFRMSA
jgi:hypothetical protein